MNKQEIAQVLEGSLLFGESFDWIFKCNDGTTTVQTIGFKLNSEKDNYAIEANSSWVRNSSNPDRKAVSCLGPWPTADEAIKILAKVEELGVFNYIVIERECIDLVLHKEWHEDNLTVMSIEIDEGLTKALNEVIAELVKNKLEDLTKAMEEN